MRFFLAVVVLAAASSAVADEETPPGGVAIPVQNYGADGKLSDEAHAVLTVNSGTVSPEQEQRFKATVGKLVKEAAALAKLAKATSKADFHKKYLAKSKKPCTFSRLGCVMSECLKRKDACPSWQLKLFEGQAYASDVAVPLQESLYGPFNASSTRQLAGLQAQFIEECYMQELAPDFAAEPRLIKLALQASQLLVASLAKEKRRELFTAWKRDCGRDNEHAADTSIRFLLSAGVRGVVRQDDVYVLWESSPGAWVCAVRTGLLHIDKCGTVSLWESEAKTTEATSKFRGLIKPLVEAAAK